MTTTFSQRTLSPAELDALSDLASVEMEGAPVSDGLKELALRHARGELTTEEFEREALAHYVFATQQ